MFNSRRSTELETQRGVFFKRDDVGPKELASLNPLAA